MRFQRLAICCLFGLLSASGCQQRIPKDELGTVIFTLPTVPGADQRPPTPEILDLPPPVETKE